MTFKTTVNGDILKTRKFRVKTQIFGKFTQFSSKQRHFLRALPTLVHGRKLHPLQTPALLPVAGRAQRVNLYWVWSPSLLCQFAAVVFLIVVIFIKLNKAVSRLQSVFKICSTREYLHYLAWEFLPYGVRAFPYSPTVVAEKHFQGFKILKYLQNTACMSFDLFTHYIYRFSINFFGINNVFKYRISFSSLRESFCVDPHGV